MTAVARSARSHRPIEWAPLFIFNTKDIYRNICCVIQGRRRDVIVTLSQWWAKMTNKDEYQKKWTRNGCRAMRTRNMLTRRHEKVLLAVTVIVRKKRLRSEMSLRECYLRISPTQLATVLRWRIHGSMKGDHEDPLSSIATIANSAMSARWGLCARSNPFYPVITSKATL